MDAKIIDICYHLLPCGTSLEYDYHMQGSTLHLPIMWTQWRIRECTAHDPLECSALNTFLQGRTLVVEGEDKMQKTMMPIRVTARDTDYHFNLGPTSHLLHSRYSNATTQQRGSVKTMKCNLSTSSKRVCEGADDRKWEANPCALYGNGFTFLLTI